MHGAGMARTGRTPSANDDKFLRAQAKRQSKIFGFDGGYEEGERVIDDPLEPGRRYTAKMNVRESAIDHMASRGRINNSQLAAGDRFRKLWEQAAIGKQLAIDPAKEYVDGGTLADPLSDDLVRAAAELSKAMQAIGPTGSKILVSVIVEGKRIEDAAIEWSKAGGIVSGRRAEGYITGTMVDALDGLTKHWRLEAEGKAKNDESFYLRNGQKVVTNDDIRTSGPIIETGPVTELVVGRFGDVVPMVKRAALDRGPMTPHVSDTASKFRRKK